MIFVYNTDNWDSILGDWNILFGPRWKPKWGNVKEMLMCGFVYLVFYVCI
jgi:hypothetical protein